MKSLVYTATMMTACAAWAGTNQPAAFSRSYNSYNAENNYVHKLGVGIILGEPTGGSLKYWLNNTMAVDGAIGWSTHDDANLYLHSDLLWNHFGLIPVPEGRLPVYLGVGGFARFRGDRHDDQAGLRLPLGLDYMFQNSPVDIFAEIAPTIDVTPDIRGDVTGGVGVRFWF